MYRLTSEQKAGVYTHSYEYSAPAGKVGNRTARVTDGVRLEYTYDDNDKLLSFGGTNVSYDRNGNPILAGTTAFYYDYENRMTGVDYGNNGSIDDTYAYNSLGQRVRESVLGTAKRFVYDGARVLVETDDSGGTQSRYSFEGPGYLDPLLHLKRLGVVSGSRRGIPRGRRRWPRCSRAGRRGRIRR